MMKNELHINEEWDETLGLYVSLPPAIFNCALKRAFWNQLASWVTDNNKHLLSLDQYMLSTRLAQWRDVGVQTIPVCHIRFNAEDGQDFDIPFLSDQPLIRHRWTSFDRARFQTAGLPLIDLLKIGDTYFLLDGHDQLSMAFIQNKDAIEARVIEVCQDNDC